MLGLNQSDLGVRRGLGFPDNLLADSEVPALVSREIPGNQTLIGAAEIVDTVSQILANVNLSIRIGDFVDDLHIVEDHSAMHTPRQPNEE
jgi:hypothetical protein